MTTANLVITPPSSTLPTCSPNLMPFHIDYTGPAGVSAYMRVEKLQPESATADFAVEEITEREETITLTTTEGNSALVEAETETTTITIATATATDIVMDDPIPTTPGPEAVTAATSRALSAATSEDTLVVESQASTSTVASSSSAPLVLEDADRRFISTFRGRAIHGLTVDLPEGYGGLLLKSTRNERVKGQDDDTKAKQMKSKAKPFEQGKAKVAEETTPAKPRGRVTRSAAAPKQNGPIEIDSEVEGGEMADATARLDNDATAPSDDKPVRELSPTARFSTFTLWHADRPVDKGRDEYARALTEWITLANDIHYSDL